MPISGAYVVASNDTAGTITITTGIDYLPTPPSQDTPYPLAAGEQVVVTFDEAFSTVPRITLTPTSPEAASMNYYITKDTTSFTIHFTNTPTASTTYSFDYQAIQ
jgi:hypothetical protein